jgi:hypothetical protein
MTEYIANALELFSQLVRSVSTDASVPMYTAIPVVSLAYRLSSLAADHKKSFRHDIEFDPDKVARETLAAMSKCEERGLDDAEVKAIERAALAESKATFLSEVCRVFAAFAVAQREYTRSYSWTLSKLHRAFGLENETQERHSLAALVVASTDEEASWLYKRMATYTSPACDAGDAIHGFVRSMASVVCARGRGWTLLDLLIVTDDGVLFTDSARRCCDAIRRIISTRITSVVPRDVMCTGDDLTSAALYVATCRGVIERIGPCTTAHQYRAAPIIRMLSDDASDKTTLFVATMLLSVFGCDSVPSTDSLGAAFESDADYRERTALILSTLDLPRATKMLSSLLDMALEAKDNPAAYVPVLWNVCSLSTIEVESMRRVLTRLCTDFLNTCNDHVALGQLTCVVRTLCMRAGCGIGHDAALRESVEIAVQRATTPIIEHHPEHTHSQPLQWHALRKAIAMMLQCNNTHLLALYVSVQAETSAHAAVPQQPTLEFGRELIASDDAVATAIEFEDAARRWFARSGGAVDDQTMRVKRLFARECVHACVAGARIAILARS